MCYHYADVEKAAILTRSGSTVPACPFSRAGRAFATSASATRHQDGLKACAFACGRKEFVYAVED